MWFLPVLIKFLFLFADGGLSFFAISRVFLHPILFIVALRNKFGLIRNNYYICGDFVTVEDP